MRTGQRRRSALVRVLCVRVLVRVCVFVCVCVAYGTIVLWLLCCDRDRQRRAAGWSVLAIAGEFCGWWIVNRTYIVVSAPFPFCRRQPPRRSASDASVPVTRNYSAQKAPAGRPNVEPFNLSGYAPLSPEKPIVPARAAHLAQYIISTISSCRALAYTTGNAARSLPNAIESS